MSNSYDVSDDTSTWIWHENKIFESAIILFPEDFPNRWEKIAKSLPGKSAKKVEQHYQKLLLDIEDIESGKIELPKYKDEMVPSKHKSPKSVATGSSRSKGKKKVAAKAPKPWSDEENRLFVLGLETHGIGAWTRISIDFVRSRNPNQCASHYQKYEQRMKKHDKDKKRPSNFDNLIVGESSTVQTSTSQGLVHPSSNGASTELPVDGSFNEDDDQFCAFLASSLEDIED